ncbi:hypothetical protein MPSEU_001052900 [Mayamaea pseudoterrestris]|nr:hypothetical protein MPSEU_001052900 [Mayamaea pseudoterrestris]
MDHSDTCTTAIALNNMAISLLERKCYRQAWETFHDAVQIACHNKTTSQSKYLSKALQRQCKPEPSKAKSPLHLEVVSDTADSITCIHATHLPNSVSLIRLEALDSTTDDAEVDGSVILHNYAVAALLLALAYPAAKVSAQLLQTCMKHLLQSQDKLSTRYEGLDMEIDYGLVQKVFVVATISTNSLLFILGRFDAEQFAVEIEECECKLETLKETLASLDQPTATDSGVVAAAAA